MELKAVMSANNYLLKNFIIHVMHWFSCSNENKTENKKKTNTLLFVFAHDPFVSRHIGMNITFTLTL